jgi:hypothetical protein
MADDDFVRRFTERLQGRMNVVTYAAMGASLFLNSLLIDRGFFQLYSERARSLTFVGLTAAAFVGLGRARSRVLIIGVPLLLLLHQRLLRLGGVISSSLE